MSKWVLPNDPKLHGKVVDAQTQDAHRRREMGLIGNVIGGGSEKAGNVAYFAIVLSFVMIVVLLYVPDSNSVPKRELMSLFGSLIVSALGFLFGRSTSKE